MAAAIVYEGDLVNDNDWEQLTTEMMEAVGAVLREERKHKKLKQAQAARLCGLTRNTISDVERSENSSHKTHYQYAVGLGLRWSVVIARAEKKLNDWRSDRGELTVADLISDEEE